MTERILYKNVQNELIKVCVGKYNLKPDDIDIVRIESPSSPGVPDINCCIKGHEFWIECKIYPNKLGSYQIAWKKKRELAGGQVFVITYKGKEAYELLYTCHNISISSSLLTVVTEIVEHILPYVQEGIIK